MAQSLKNKILNEVCDQLGIKRFGNSFCLQGNAMVENIHHFLDKSNLKLDEFLPPASYCYNIFPGSNNTKSLFFLMFGWDPEGCLSHLNNSNMFYGTNEDKVVLEELHILWNHHTNHLRQMPQRIEHKDVPSCNNNQVWSWSTSHDQEPCMPHILTKISARLASTANT